MKCCTCGVKVAAPGCVLEGGCTVQCGHSGEPGGGICMTGEGNGCSAIHPLEKPRPGPIAAEAGQTQALGKATITHSAFSSSWLGLGRLLPGKEPGGEGPSLKLLGRS